MVSSVSRMPTLAVGEDTCSPLAPAQLPQATPGQSWPDFLQPYRDNGSATGGGDDDWYSQLQTVIQSLGCNNKAPQPEPCQGVQPAADPTPKVSTAVQQPLMQDRSQLDDELLRSMHLEEFAKQLGVMFDKAPLAAAGPGDACGPADTPNPGLGLAKTDAGALRDMLQRCADQHGARSAGQAAEPDINSTSCVYYLPKGLISGPPPMIGPTRPAQQTLKPWHQPAAKALPQDPAIPRQLAVAPAGAARNRPAAPAAPGPFCEALNMEVPPQAVQQAACKPARACNAAAPGPGPAHLEGHFDASVLSKPRDRATPGLLAALNSDQVGCSTAAGPAAATHAVGHGAVEKLPAPAADAAAAQQQAEYSCTAKIINAMKFKLSLKLDGFNMTIEQFWDACRCNPKDIHMEPQEVSMVLKGIRRAADVAAAAADAASATAAAAVAAQEALLAAEQSGTSTVQTVWHFFLRLAVGAAPQHNLEHAASDKVVCADHDEQATAELYAPLTEQNLMGDKKTPPYCKLHRTAKWVEEHAAPDAAPALRHLASALAAVAAGSC